ncbi:MAG: PAS domain S-box protein [Deltaproteobacteria bacterium]|nr:PAS domain S-box protein [Deltaproteobacteria bacterium]
MTADPGGRRRGRAAAGRSDGRSDAALLESEERFRAVFETAPDGIFIADLQGKILDVNEALCAQIGYRREQLLELTVRRVIAPKYLESAQRSFAQERAQAGYIETVALRSDGTEMPLELAFRRIQVRGQPALLGIARDMRERRHYEAALRTTQAAVDRAPDMVFWIDRHGRFAYANEVACCTLGYTDQELFERCVWDIDPHFRPERWLPFWEQLKAQHSIVRDTEQRRKDGRTVPVEVSSSYVEFEGQEFVLAFARDISERKSTELAILHVVRGVSAESGDAFFPELVRSLATALEVELSLVAQLSDDGAEVKTIAAWLDGAPVQYDLALGGTPFEESVGRGPCMYPNDVQGRFPGATLLRELGMAGYVGSPLRDSAGQVLGLIAVMSRTVIHRAGFVASMLEICATRAASELERMISERDRQLLEAQLRHAQKMEAVGRLAAGVAHDFNNVLTTISLHTEMMMAVAGPSSPLQSDLHDVSKAAERATALTSQLLAFSRKQPILPTIVDLNELVGQSSKMLERLIGEDVELEFVAGADLSTVKADPCHLEQVLTNVAVNARDAMPQGGKLTLTTENTFVRDSLKGGVGRKEGPYAMLSVSDTGCGMSEEVLAHLFEPFFTTKEKGKGTGLGLSTVYGIVQQNGGFVDVESGVGKGTTFRIYLPACAGVATTQAARSPVVLPVGRETLLVVEDEPTVRRVASRILTRQGYQVLVGSSGEEALELCDAHPGVIDLLLTDVIMPKMNGWQLYERLRASRPTLKVLFMSGYTGEEISPRGVLPPGTAYIQKPFRMEVLVGMVREALDTRRST